MTQILSKVSITDSINKVVETTDGLILNGHYYDKASMSPQPLDLYAPIGAAFDLSMSKRIPSVYFTSYGVIENYGKGSLIVRDSNDKDITYVFTENSRSTKNSFLVMKISEKDGSSSYIAYGTPNVTYFADSCPNRVYDVIGQNDTTIFALGTSYYPSSSSTNVYCSILSIDKATLKVSIVETYGPRVVANVVVDTPMHSYILLKGQYGVTAARRFNKISGVSEIVTVTSVNGSVVYQQSTPSNGIEVEEGKFLVYTLSEVANKMTFTKRIIDTTIESLLTCANQQEGTATYTIKEGLEVTELPVLPSSIYNRYHLEVTNYNGKNYLNVFVSDTTGTLTGNIGKYGIYTFLINEDYSLKLTCFSPTAGVIATGYITNHKKDAVLCLTTGSMKYYLFDPVIEGWVQIFAENTTMSSAGFDLSDNLWYCDTVGGVYMVSPSKPVSVSLTMERDDYKYDGTNIDTNLVISVKNMSGVRVGAKFKLTIKGSAVFPATDSKVTTVTSTDLEDLLVPITIKDGGQIMVYPELLI